MLSEIEMSAPLYSKQRNKCHMVALLNEIIWHYCYMKTNIETNNSPTTLDTGS